MKSVTKATKNVEAFHHHLTIKYQNIKRNKRTRSVNEPFNLPFTLIFIGNKMRKGSTAENRYVCVCV